MEWPKKLAAVVGSGARATISHPGLPLSVFAILLPTGGILVLIATAWRVGDEASGQIGSAAATDAGEPGFWFGLGGLGVLICLTSAVTCALGIVLLARNEQAQVSSGQKDAEPHGVRPSDPERAARLDRLRSERQFNRYLVGTGYALLLVGVLCCVGLAGLIYTRRVDPYGAAWLNRSGLEEGIAILLLVSVGVSIFGALFYVANALRTKRNSGERFSENRFWGGLWFRLGEAALFSLVIFWLIWMRVDLSTPERRLASVTTSIIDGGQFPLTREYWDEVALLSEQIAFVISNATGMENRVDDRAALASQASSIVDREFGSLAAEVIAAYAAYDQERADLDRALGVLSAVRDVDEDDPAGDRAEPGPSYEERIAAADSALKARLDAARTRAQEIQRSAARQIENLFLMSSINASNAASPTDALTYQLLPVLSLLIGMFVTAGETLMFAIARALFRAVAAFFGVELPNDQDDPPPPGNGAGAPVPDPPAPESRATDTPASSRVPSGVLPDVAVYAPNRPEEDTSTSEPNAERDE